MEITIEARDQNGWVRITRYKDGSRFIDKGYEPPVADNIINQAIDLIEKEMKNA